MNKNIFSSFYNKTKDLLWSLNAAQPVGNIMFKWVVEK